MSEKVKRAETRRHELTIATGGSRHETKWKNIAISYEDFTQRLREPIRTHETVAEYARMSKSRQTEAKDVGGFVGASLKEGRRRKGSVAFRSMITLDVDFAGSDIDALWAKILAAYDVSCILYPTHSHTPKKPRYRLIFPLSEPVQAEQYEPIARRVASEIGINLFDDTTYEPERLMFWPSIPKDAPYDELVREYEGEWLDPKEILATYDDWTDTSFWPTSDRESVRVRREIEKQQDPTEKRGIIGAFCRTYTVDDAIAAFLSDVYMPATAGRYTYIEGSSVAGLVVYEGLWAYSHHGTDPISGELCNAFDLVRLHRFGGMDDEAKTGTPSHKLPSFLAMQDFAAKDPRVKALVHAETEAEIEADFSFTSEPVSGESDELDWFVELVEVDKQGRPLETIDNVVSIIKHDKMLKGRLRQDIFAKRKTVMGAVPWDLESTQPRDWVDSDDDGLAWYLETYYKIKNSRAIASGLGKAFIDLSYHPVREYLESLPEWDGVRRVESLLPDYLGAEDTPYIHAITKIHLVAAIARVMTAGVKYDTMITLSGAQGIGKSTFIRILGGDWYSNSLDTMKGKEAYEALQGAWIIEIDELSAFKKAEKERIKGFLSKTEDIFRPAYARHTVRYKRQCVFWGTTNDRFFLRDSTGDRRTWPVACGVQYPIKSVFSDLEKERGQIWAEALAYYKEGQALTLPYELVKVAEAQQAAFSEEDPQRDMIAEFLERMIPENWSGMSLSERLSWLDGDGFFSTDASGRLVKREKITALEIWCECFGRREADFERPEASRINELLSRMEGWKWSETKQSLGAAYGHCKRRGYVRA